MKRFFFVGALLCVACTVVSGQKMPRTLKTVVVKATVVDERLSAVRSKPGLSQSLLFRARRGRSFAVTDWKAADGLIFLKVRVSSKRAGWIQWDAVVIKDREGEDARLLKLVVASDGYERIDRAHLFLEVFAKSPLRPSVLLILGDSAQGAAAKLSRDAVRRVRIGEVRPLVSNDFQLRSFYLSSVLLDRYARIGVRFTFDLSTMKYSYDGAAWREIVRLYPLSPEAEIARERMAKP